MLLKKKKMYSQQLENLMGQQFTMDFGCDVDEDELDEELAELDDEMFMDELENKE